MTEDELRQLIGRVRRGQLSRRGFAKAAGLAAPLATQLLALAGAAPAAAQGVPEYRPTGRRGGALRILYWQAATMPNPHFAVGTTNADASRVFYEPLAGWAQDGTLHPCWPSASRPSRTGTSPPMAGPSPGA
jgi:peptide/nickel transport system substrate-binding protein